MYDPAHPGVGLASPQVGVNVQLVVINKTCDSSQQGKERVLINPTIVERSEDMVDDLEGCLSFPETSGTVQRHRTIKVRYLNLEGNLVQRTFKGFEARIVQHEIDHLDGRCYIDRVTGEDDLENLKGPLKEMERKLESGGRL